MSGEVERGNSPAKLRSISNGASETPEHIKLIGDGSESSRKRLAGNRYQTDW